MASPTITLLVVRLHSNCQDPRIRARRTQRSDSDSDRGLEPSEDDGGASGAPRDMVRGREEAWLGGRLSPSISYTSRWASARASAADVVVSLPVPVMVPVGYAEPNDTPMRPGLSVRENASLEKCAPYLSGLATG